MDHKANNTCTRREGSRLVSPDVAEALLRRAERPPT
jgi:hypothetical protein